MRRLRRRIDRLNGELRGLDVGLRDACVQQRRGDGGHQLRVGVGRFLDGLALSGHATSDLGIVRRDVDAAFANHDHTRVRLGRWLLRLRARRNKNCQGHGWAGQKEARRSLKREFFGAARSHDDLRRLRRRRLLELEADFLQAFQR
jgi:hypothetical protein